MSTPLQQAIASAGGQNALADELSRITGRRYRQSQVSNWVNRTGHPPANVVLAIERITGVPRSELRPDVFELK